MIKSHANNYSSSQLVNQKEKKCNDFVFLICASLFFHRQTRAGRR